MLVELTFLVQNRANGEVDAAMSASTVDWYYCDAVPSDGDAGDVDDGGDVVEILDDVDVARESDGDVAMAVTFQHLRNVQNALHRQQRRTVALPSGQHWMLMLSPLSTQTA